MPRTQRLWDGFAIRPSVYLDLPFAEAAQAARSRQLVPARPQPPIYCRPPRDDLEPGPIFKSAARPLAIGCGSKTALFGAACAPICALIGKVAEKPGQNRQKRHAKWRQILCFDNTRRFSEIGLVRRIFDDFAHPTHLGYQDGFGPGSRLYWQLKVHPVAHRAPRSPTHSWHILGILGRFWRVRSMPSMYRVCGWSTE